MVADAGERFVAEARLITGESQPRTFTVESVRMHKGDYLVSLSGVSDKTTADDLVGIQFVIDPADRRALDDGEWWVEDLIGRSVVSVDGSAIGVVSDAVTGSAQDRLVVEATTGVVFEVPFVDELVPEVGDDVITVDLPPGLTEG